MLSQSDAGGGAAVAARRLQQGLQDLGVDAEMLVRRKSLEDESVMTTARWAGTFVDRVRFALDKVPLLGYPGRDGTPFSPQWLPDGLNRRIEHFRPNILNIHWIGHGYLHPATLTRLGVAIVWTLHDVWPFSGGCHVNLGCTGYEGRCGACPRLGSTKDEDLSRMGWRRKHNAWSGCDMTLIAPSSWIAECARKSTLFRNRRIEVISNGLDTQKFRPADRQASRRVLGLPPDAKLILFATASAHPVPHKGFDLLERALDRLGASPGPGGDIELVLAGPQAWSGSTQSALRTHRIGMIRDEVRMASLYNAVDVTVVPSRQENLPQVAVESLACGTPVVAFDTTGIPDVVDHEQDGYLARPFDTEDLGRGVKWVLESDDRRRRLSEAGRSKVLRAFDLSRQAAAYQSLFKELLEARLKTSAA